MPGQQEDESAKRVDLIISRGKFPVDRAGKLFQLDPRKIVRVRLHAPEPPPREHAPEK